MMIKRVAVVALLAAATAMTACDTARSVDASSTAAAGGCVGCHGGAENDTGAPPLDAHGASTGPQVGAHSSHLAAGVACETCHKVPATVDAPGHIGGDKVVFGAAARQGGASPRFVPADPASPAGGTCSTTYCHGGTLGAGGRLHTPTWNGPPAACGDCHAVPPPSHGDVANCALCHAESVNPDLTFKSGKHVDGTLQVDLVGCAGCHGDANRRSVSPLERLAPPVDTSGQTTSARVGAHQTHLVDGPLAKAVACTECHVIPYSLAHATQPNPVVVFNGPLGRKNGATPTYANGTCSNVYCHGGGTTPLAGGTIQSPSWSGSGQAACGTCHGFVPPAPHPQVDLGGAALSLPAQCSDCHPGTVNADGSMFVQNGLHVNGVVDAQVHPGGWLAAIGAKQPHGLAANHHDAAWPGGIDDCRACHGADLNGAGVATSCNGCHAAAGKADWQTSCTFCHGEPNRATAPAAPPVDTQGRTAATERGVGAHQTHLLGKQPTGAISDGVACADCHAAQPYTDIAHVDGVRAVALKQPGSATAAGTFDDAAGTCASTYCHGGFRNGKSANAPSWIATSGQADCSTCHAPQAGADAGGYTDRHQRHLGFGLACAACHVEGYDSRTTPPTVNAAAHVNGTVDLNAPVGWDAAAHTCTTSCHPGPRPWY